jgi:uncharacterized phage protein gp47/JayE
MQRVKAQARQIILRAAKQECEKRTTEERWLMRRARTPKDEKRQGRKEEGDEDHETNMPGQLFTAKIGSRTIESLR